MNNSDTVFQKFARAIKDKIHIHVVCHASVHSKYILASVSISERVLIDNYDDSTGLAEKFKKLNDFLKSTDIPVARLLLVTNIQPTDDEIKSFSGIFLKAILVTHNPQPA